MQILSKEMMRSIERQIYNRARDIDVAIFNALVDEDSKDFVLDCLYLYLNNDGGFGGGLEIDNYNTGSSVYQVYEAFRILAMLGFDSKSENPLFSNIINKSCNFLFNKNKLDDNRWNPVIPTNNKFAHSEEYSYSENVMEKWQFHPTAALVGYILLFTDPSKPYYKKALRLLKPCINYIVSKESATEYDIISYNALLGSLKQLNGFDEEIEKIESSLLKLWKSVENDNFDYATNFSNVNLDNELLEKVNQSLDDKINSIAPHGLWEYNKDWKNGDIYPEAESAKLKWLGARSVNEVAILKRYNRIEK